MHIDKLDVNTIYYVLCKENNKCTIEKNTFTDRNPDDYDQLIDWYTFLTGYRNKALDSYLRNLSAGTFDHNPRLDEKTVAEYFIRNKLGLSFYAVGMQFTDNELRSKISENPEKYESYMVQKEFYEVLKNPIILRQ